MPIGLKASQRIRKNIVGKSVSGMCVNRQMAGPKTDPWGTLAFILCHLDDISKGELNSELFVWQIIVRTPARMVVALIDLYVLQITLQMTYTTLRMYEYDYIFVQASGTITRQFDNKFDRQLQKTSLSLILNMKLPEINRCCFCCPLRWGILLFGYINVVSTPLIISYYDHSRKSTISSS